MFAIVFIIILLVLLFIGVPVAFSLGLTTSIGIFLQGTLPLNVVPQRIFVALNSFPLMAIPFLFWREI